MVNHGIIHDILDSRFCRSGRFSSGNPLCRTVVSGQRECRECHCTHHCHYYGSSGGGYPPAVRLALDIEDSVITVAALIPWSVAAAVPLAVLGVGPAALPLAFFLWLLPLSRLLLDRGKL